MAMVSAAFVGRAQYQLPNPGFEQWDGAAVDAEPTHWNSFATADGSYASMASSPHHYHRHGHRPGGEGSHYLTIYTTSMFFGAVKANGNMTTGCIHVGGMSTTSTDNYNYTIRSNAAFSQPFSGTPDSMYVWVSFYAASASSQAQVTATLHGDSDFRSPNDESNASLYCGKAQTRFSRTTGSGSAMQWVQKKVAFDYSGTADPHYMLVSFTTNYQPGEGSANDSLSIDDIEFIYSAWLNDIVVNGTSVEGFAKGTFAYQMELADTAILSALTVAAVTEVDDATAVVGIERLTDSTALATIDVTAEDGVTVKQYTVAFHAPMPAPVPEPPVEVPTYTVTVTCDATMGSVNPTGEIQVDSAHTVAVTATAAAGYRFIGWSIDPGYASLVTDNPLVLTVESDLSVTANFEEAPQNGIGDVEAEILSVYPNPATRWIAVEGRGGYVLTDLKGRELMRGTAPTRLDISGLADGIYLLRCGEATLRVVKVSE